MKRRARFQQTLASQASFEKYGRKSKRELFLDQMNQVVPWSELLGLVEPVYPKAGNGRQPVGLAIMLRTYFLQQWFGLSDPGMEEAFYESPVLRRFAGVDLGVAAAPDETTILRFRHLLEQHDLCGEMLDDGEPLPGNQGHPHHHRHHRRRDDYPCAQFDQERERQSATPRCIRPRRATSGTSGPRRTSAWIARRWWCIR